MLIIDKFTMEIKRKSEEHLLRDFRIKAFDIQ